jgi:hypothetical protein
VAESAHWRAFLALLCSKNSAEQVVTAVKLPIGIVFYSELTDTDIDGRKRKAAKDCLHGAGRVSVCSH